MTGPETSAAPPAARASIPGSGHQVQCPACGGTIAIKAAGYTVSVACQYCGSLIDVAKPEVSLIAEYHEAMADLALPLGARGVLAGVQWEVIGYQERHDDEAEWGEYLLFNPYAGYRWLTHADDEWYYGTMLTDLPGDAWGGGVSWRGQRFSCDYEPVETVTDRVVGEFYWRVKAGDTVAAATFEGSGSELSYERAGDETSWTLIQPLARGMVESAFAAGGSAAATPSPGGFGRKGLSGAAAAAATRAAPDWLAAKDREPAPKSALADAFMMFLVGLGTFIACALVMGLFGMTSTVATSEISLRPGAPEQTFTVGTVTITRPYQAISVTATTSSFVNKWVDLDYNLVDRKTQQAINAYGVVEYYEGTDSDGRWSEGSHSTTTKFAGVPAGTYDVMVDAAVKNWSGGASSGDAWNDGVTVRLALKRGGVFFSNLLIILLLLLVPPAFMIWRAVKRAQEGYDD